MQIQTLHTAFKQQNGNQSYTSLETGNSDHKIISYLVECLANTIRVTVNYKVRQHQTVLTHQIKINTDRESQKIAFCTKAWKYVPFGDSVTVAVKSTVIMFALNNYISRTLLHKQSTV